MSNAAGPYFPMVNGRFIVPQASIRCRASRTRCAAGNVIKGYVISADDEFSVDGNVVYTVNAVNVVKATNQATLAGAEPNQTLTAGALTYTLDTSQKQARIQPAGVTYNTGTQTVHRECQRHAGDLHGRARPQPPTTGIRRTPSLSPPPEPSARSPIRRPA